MVDLSQQSCKACEGGVDPLNHEEATAMLAQVNGWELSEDGREIHQTFRFEDYYQTMAFVNAVAWIAHREFHHPTLLIGYSRCEVHYRTSAIGGLSENDFICAAKIDALQKAGNPAS